MNERPTPSEVFVHELAKSLGIYRLLDWLTERPDRQRRRLAVLASVLMAWAFLIVALAIWT